jgi:hypothetical protein
MNFLFNALIITLLLLPGVILRLSYLSIFYSKKTFRSSFAEELLLSLLPTFIIQFIGFLIVRHHVNVQTIYLLLINSDKTIQYNFNSTSITNFLLYCLVVYTFAALLGYFIRKLVIKYSLDVRIPLLRLYNDWYYHLWGFAVLNERGKKSFRETDNVWLDILVDNQDGSYIYSGWLYEFILSKEEGLDFLCLNSVRRRRLDKDEREETPATNKPSFEKALEESQEINISYDDYEDSNHTVEQVNNYIDNRYYDMPGQNFIIPYKEVKNINIIYFIEEEG